MPCSIKRPCRRAFSSRSRRTSARVASEIESSQSVLFKLEFRSHVASCLTPKSSRTAESGRRWTLVTSGWSVIAVAVDQSCCTADNVTAEKSPTLASGPRAVAICNDAAVTALGIRVVPGAFQTMRKKKVLVIDESLQCQVLLPANAAMGDALVILCAGKSSDRRIRASVGTAHDVLQVAVAYHVMASSLFLAQSVRILPGLNGKFQTHCLRNSNQCGQARIAVRRQCSVQALTLDTSGLGHLGNTTPGFSYTAQGYQEHPRLFRVLQRRSQVFGGEVWIFPKLPNHRFVMRGAGLVFHGLRVLSL